MRALRRVMNPFIIVGRITKPHGIKGELCVDFYADSPSILGDTVWLKQKSKASLPYPVLAARYHHDRLLMSLAGVPDRDAAESLRGAEITIPRERLPKLASGEVYLADLPGFTIILQESGEVLGKISAVDLSSGQEIWRITTQEGKEVLFPAVPEFVNELDPENRSARISPPPGLLEIYL